MQIIIYKCWVASYKFYLYSTLRFPGKRETWSGDSCIRYLYQLHDSSDASTVLLQLRSLREGCVTRRSKNMERDDAKHKSVRSRSCSVTCHRAPQYSTCAATSTFHLHNHEELGVYERKGLHLVIIQWDGVSLCKNKTKPPTDYLQGIHPKPMSLEIKTLASAKMDARLICFATVQNMFLPWRFLLSHSAVCF